MGARRVEEGDMGDEVEREDGGCTGKRGRVESKGGRVTDQHNRHCQPTQLFPVLRLYPSPGPGPDHSYSPPPSHLSYFLIVSVHTAPSVIPHSIWSAPFASPPVSAPTPGAVLLCHLVGSSSDCQPNPPPNTVVHHRLLRHAQTGRPVSL